MRMRINRHLLRGLREQAGISRYRLAKDAQTTTTYIREIELGEKNPSPAVITRLAVALGVPVTAIIADPEAAREAS